VLGWILKWVNIEGIKRKYDIFKWANCLTIMKKKTQVQGLNRGFFLRLRGGNNPSRRKGSSALNMKNKGCMSQILIILANQAYWVSLALLRTQDLYTHLTFRNYIVVDVLNKSHETHTHTRYISIKLPEILTNLKVGVE
jgi:hypothetical protein